MADIFDFYVYDDRSIRYEMAEPIMLEDKDVTEIRFRIPKSLNGFDMSTWAWWFIYVNARHEKYSIPLTLVDDEDEPDTYSIATFSINYGITGKDGAIDFALEVIDADEGGEILHEWHTRTYTTSVILTLQGNQTEFSQSESDIISALIKQIQEKTAELVGGATPKPVASISEMTDTEKIYVLTTDKKWYYYNGTAWVAGGLYASGITIDTTLTKSGQAADAKVTGDKLNAKAPVIINSTIEDTAVSFRDGADEMPMQSLMLNLAPHQDGTGDPSPTNVRPISGWTKVNVVRTGKNIANIIQNSKIDNAEIISTSTTDWRSDKILVGSETHVTLTIYDNGTYTGSIGLVAFDESGTMLSSFNLAIDAPTVPYISTRALPSGTKYIYLRGYMSSDGGTKIGTVKMQIEFGSASTEYEDSASTTYPVTIPSSAGTVYGGELDVVKGTLKVTHGYVVFDGSNDENWAQSGDNRMMTSISESYAEGYTRIAVTANRGVFGTGSAVGTTFLSNQSLYYYQPTDITTVSAFRSWLASNNLQVVYPLATPIEIALTPTEITTLLGNNTIFMDADGTVKADYPVDTKLYIDALTAPDDDMIADANIESGKYFTVNNRLYLSTSAIAQGEAIVPGTNCTQTDLASALNIIKEA